MQTSKDSLCESSHSLCCVGSRDTTQVIRLGGKCPHPTSHHAGLHLQALPRGDHLYEPSSWFSPVPQQSSLSPRLLGSTVHMSSVLFLPNQFWQHQSTNFLPSQCLMPLCTESYTTPCRFCQIRGLFSPFVSCSKACSFSQTHCKLQMQLSSQKEHKTFFSEPVMSIHGQEHRLELSKYHIPTRTCFQSGFMVIKQNKLKINTLIQITLVRTLEL